MRRFLLIPVCFISLLVPVAVLAGGGESGFEGVVRTIETRYHVRATRIPFLGLISFVSRKATGGGVSNLHIAEFEHFSPVMDGDELNQIDSSVARPILGLLLGSWTCRRPGADYCVLQWAFS